MRRHAASACCSGWTTSSTTRACARRCRARSTTASSSSTSTRRAWRRSAAGPGAATGWPSWSTNCSTARRSPSLGFDVVFAEPDDSSGLKRLRQLAQGELKDSAGFAERIDAAAGRARLRRALRQVAEEAARSSWATTSPATAAGTRAACCRQPVMEQGQPARAGRSVHQLERLRRQHRAARQGRAGGGLLQPDRRRRRRRALGPAAVAEYKDQYYESLSLAMFRIAGRLAAVEPGFPPEKHVSAATTRGSRASCCGSATSARDPGGRAGGDAGAVPRPRRRRAAARSSTFPRPTCSSSACRAGTLKGKIVLVGTTAPGPAGLAGRPRSARRIPASRRTPT